MTEDQQTPSGDAADIDPALADDAEVNLLSSPIERTLVNRVFVLGGPLALLATIVVSLWVSWTHVPYYTAVAADTVWVAGQTRAVRVMITSERGYEPGRTPVQLAIEQEGERTELPALEAVAVGIAQGTVAVPESLRPGPARLHLSAELSPEPVHETLEITVAERSEARTPKHVISSVPAQYSNDTEDQPPNVKIDLRVHGRVQTGFDNRFYVRITDPQGQPWSGPVEVVMIKGELGEHVATPDAPVTIVRGTTDRMGLLSWGGMLISELVRLRVQVMSRSNAAEQVAARKIMLVSFPGVVAAGLDRAVAQPADELELSVAGLSGKRAIYLDVHDGDGAWVSTLPPVLGRQPPRPWSVPSVTGAGFVQLEAYDQVTTPGESTAVVRLQLARQADTPISLRPLIDAQKDALSLPRTDTSFDADRERAWLDGVGAMDLSVDEVEGLRQYLIGTLPVSVYGPPPALSTKLRDDEALATFKRRWTVAMRWVLLGGGGLFLVAMTVMMGRAHAAAADKTREALRQLSDDDDRDLVVSHVGAEQRQAMFRGLGLIAVMAGALVLAVLMLEAMVWEF